MSWDLIRSIGKQMGRITIAPKNSADYGLRMLFFASGVGLPNVSALAGVWWAGVSDVVWLARTRTLGG